MGKQKKILFYQTLTINPHHVERRGLICKDCGLRAAKTTFVKTVVLELPQLSTLNPQPSTLNPQPSTFNIQPSTLNPQPSTLSPQPSALNPQPSTLNPQTSTLNFILATLTPQPSTLKSLNLHPSTLDHQLEPSTLKP